MHALTTLIDAILYMTVGDGFSYSIIAGALIIFTLAICDKLPNDSGFNG